MELMKFFGRGVTGLALLLVGFMLLGCQSPDDNYKFNALPQNGAPTGAPTASTPAPVASGTTPTDANVTILHVNEAITVSFADTPNQILPIEDTIKEDGSITLIYNQKFQAAGKTVGALQEEIRERYVPQYFKYLTPSIKAGDRFFNIGGEVRSPGRQAYVTTMTVLRAIDTGGGFTDFAAKKRVQLTRAGSGKVITVNCVKALTHPDLDLEVFPGDKIFVPRRLF
jgi:protein involved in polysaccharide export with SLBB domain